MWDEGKFVITITVTVTAVIVTDYISSSESPLSSTRYFVSSFLMVFALTASAVKICLILAFAAPITADISNTFIFSELFPEIFLQSQSTVLFVITIYQLLLQIEFPHFAHRLVGVNEPEPKT